MPGGKGEPAWAGRVEGDEPAAFAAQRGPVAFVGIVANEVVEVLHVVDVEGVLHEVAGEHGADAQRIVVLVVRELDDVGGACRHEPELGSDRAAVELE